MEDNISPKWSNIGLNNKQEIIDEINKAFEKKEKLDSNIYVGKSNHGNICMCLDENGKIEKAFPALINKEDYQKIRNKVETIILEEPNDLYLQVISLFLTIDINNHKEEVLNGLNDLPKDLELDLFNCTITEGLTIIIMELGQIVINTKYVKDFLKKGIIE